MKTELGPKQLAWCRSHWKAFRDLEAAVERIRREAEMARMRAGGAI